VRDGPAEGAVGGPLGVDVNPLVVVGGIREKIDALLCDLEPLARAELTPRRCRELAERDP